MAKLNSSFGNNQKPTHLVYLGFSVNHEIQLLKSSKKITDSQILKFKKEAVGFLANLCTHFIEKNQVKSFFDRCLGCLSPNYFGECSEKFFVKVLSQLVSYKVVTPDTADHSKSQYNIINTIVVKENKPEFLNYSKTDQSLDRFVMKFVRASKDLLNYTNSSIFYWYYCMLRLKLGPVSLLTEICFWKINTQQL